MRNIFISIKKVPTPYLLLAVFLIIGLLRFVLFFIQSPLENMTGLFGTFGIITGWAAYATALSICLWALVVRIRRKETHLLNTRILPTLTIICGASLTYTAGALLLRSSQNMETALELAIPGILMSSWFVFLWRRPPTRKFVSGLVLGAVIFLFVLPREDGTISMEWNKGSAQSTSNADSTWSCNGVNLHGRSDVLSEYQANYDIQVVSGQNQFSQLINRELNSPSKGKKTAASVNVTVSGGDPGVGCYLPLFHFNQNHTTVSVAIGFQTGDGSLKNGEDGWNLSCNASSQITYRSDRLLFGIASCRNLLEKDAAELSQKIQGEIDVLLGHKR